MKDIYVEQVYKSFGEKEVLKDLSFSMSPGDILGITGESGSGKSTLIHLLGLLASPDSGVISWWGEKNISPFSCKANQLLRQKISFVFQHYALLDEYTVYQNLRMAMKYISMNKQRKDYLIQDALKEVGLSSFLHEPVINLSGGEKQRVAIARLLLKPCELILVDEPTANLDEKNKLLVWDLLKRFSHKDKMILLVSHDPSLIKFCDEVIVLNKHE